MRPLSSLDKNITAFAKALAGKAKVALPIAIGMVEHEQLNSSFNENITAFAKASAGKAKVALPISIGMVEHDPPAGGSGWPVR